jgi:phosphate starvation-inducible PhoH-like protein
MSTRKKRTTNSRTKRTRDREDRELENEIHDSIVESSNPNPIKRALKIKQFQWTDKQKEFFKVALAENTKIVFVKGPAGTSKSLLSVYCGLQLLNNKTISDIMYLRSAVESSESRLGFLPGSADEKLRFYNLPFLDKLDELVADATSERLEKEGRISMYPVNFARGMNWKSKCIILDEAQNSTKKEITTVLTRLGEGTRCFILADPMQTDLHRKELQGGFEDVLKTFSNEESQSWGIETFEFTEEDVMRSALVKYIVKKLRQG